MSKKMNPDRTVMLLSIIGRGKGKSYMEMLKERGIHFHMQSVGYGTAPSEMMDILGLGTNDKDVIISFSTYRAAATFATDFGKDLGSNLRFGGLAMVLSPSAVNRLTAEILARSDTNNSEKGVTAMPKSEYKHKLILIMVNRDFTDQVMQTAKRAGATGGTIIRARVADAAAFEQFVDMQDQEEKDILAILSPGSACRQIMEDVNREFGLNTEANGIVCSIPVEKAFKV